MTKMMKLKYKSNRKKKEMITNNNINEQKNIP